MQTYFSAFAKPVFFPVFFFFFVFFLFFQINPKYKPLNFPPMQINQLFSVSTKCKIKAVFAYTHFLLMLTANQLFHLCIKHSYAEHISYFTYAKRKPGFCCARVCVVLVCVCVCVLLLFFVFGCCFFFCFFFFLFVFVVFFFFFFFFCLCWTTYIGVRWNETSCSTHANNDETWAPREDSDQPALSRSLIRIFTELHQLFAVQVSIVWWNNEDLKLIPCFSPLKGILQYICNVTAQTRWIRTYAILGLYRI